MGQVVDGTQTHWLFALQDVPVGQVPHVIVLPQPSDAVPHCCPAGQPVGTQPQVPLLLQVWPLGQEPQLTVPPQPSGAVPQVCPAGHVVLGWQTQVLLLLQTDPGAHVPH